MFSPAMLSEGEGFRHGRPSQDGLYSGYEARGRKAILIRSQPAAVCPSSFCTGFHKIYLTPKYRPYCELLQGDHNKES